MDTFDENFKMAWKVESASEVLVFLSLDKTTPPEMLYRARTAFFQAIIHFADEVPPHFRASILAADATGIPSKAEAMFRGIGAIITTLSSIPSSEQKPS